MTGEAIGEIPHNLYPFTERSGDRAEHDFAVILADPEVVLTDEQKQEVYEFQQGLFVGKVGTITCSAVDHETGNVIDLEALDKKKVKTDERTYYLGYFDTAKGQQDLEKLGVSSAAELANVTRQRIAVGEEVDKKAFRSAAVRSDKWFRNQLIAQLEQPSESDADFVESDSFTVHFAPNDLLNKFAAYRDYKEFYKQVGRALKEEPDSAARTAKEAWLNVYRGTINYRMALLYPSMWKVTQQLAGSEQTEAVQQWVGRLGEVAPLMHAVYRQEQGQEERRERFICGFGRRLDLLRYGAVYKGPGENYSPISPKLYEFITTHQAEQPPEPMIDPEIIAEMKSTVWNAEEFKKFVEAVLDAQGLLSAERATWGDVEDRKGSAEDNKWQAVISPKHDNLSTEASKKIQIIPEGTDRSLIQQDPSGPVPVEGHENVHVQQAEANDDLSETVPLAKTGARRDLMLAEMGGVREEKIMFALLGIKRRINEFYLRGLQRKLDGGNIAQVARVVYDVVLQTSGRQPDAATREYAVDRARRLYRYDGYNSQPLDYIEQELALRALDGQPEGRVRSIAIALTAFAPMDIAALYRVGALDLPSADDIPVSADTTLKVYMEKFHRR